VSSRHGIGEALLVAGRLFGDGIDAMAVGLVVLPVKEEQLLKDGILAALLAGVPDENPPISWLRHIDDFHLGA
jgi:hypothetical protein